MSAPSDDDLIRVAGFSPFYARVLATVFLGSVGAALIDTNGDDREVEFQLLLGDADGRWVSGTSYGAGSYAEGRSGSRLGYAYGHDPDRYEMQIEFRGAVWSAPVQASGWWIFLTECNEDEQPPALKLPPAPEVGLTGENPAISVREWEP